MVSFQKQGCSASNGRFHALEQKIDKLTSQLANAEIEIATQIEGIDTKVGGLDTKVGEMLLKESEGNQKLTDIFLSRYFLGKHCSVPLI